MKKRQRLVNQVNGIDDYDNPLYQPLQDTEHNAELYWGACDRLADGAAGTCNTSSSRAGVGEVDNALVAGIKIQTVF